METAQKKLEGVGSEAEPQLEANAIQDTPLDAIRQHLPVLERAADVSLEAVCEYIHQTGNHIRRLQEMNGDEAQKTQCQQRLLADSWISSRDTPWV